ncbi:MAG: molybdopterin molybdotransferase MoeA, partial [Halomonas sp.]
MADLQPIDAALVALLADVCPVAIESVLLEAAAGRVLADAVTAQLNVPPFDNSAMDGYALRAVDAGKWLPVSQRIAAGTPAQALAPGSCARIFTGGEIPPGADCVVMQERVDVDGERALIPADVPSGDNVRRRGRDVRQGSVLLNAGERLEAAALGHLAGQGVTQVSVRRRPRVALLSTGDEIIDPGTPLKPGQLYNSNRPMLKRLLENFGAEVVSTVSVPDDYARTVALLKEAAEADLVVTTGGVSVGEEDHVKAALEAIGQLDMWKLAIRPGKPLALGRLPRRDGSQARFVGLPGNPVSGFVGAWLFLRPLLGTMLGCPALSQLPTITASANFATS